jgi:EAL domain-containing protein (putative c-di-GMP-specific phosphodiesterase class I)
MGLQTIAKSVEDSDTFQQLWQLGVDYAQGYCLGEPVPLDVMLAGCSH